LTPPDPAAREATGPDAVAPDAVAPDAVAPDAVAPDAVAPDAVAPDVVGRDRAASDSAASHPVAADAVGPGSRGPFRTVAGRVLLGLAGLLVLVVLVAPTDVGRLTPLALLRVPVEGLLAVALLLVLPPRPRRITAIVLGGALGLLTIGKVADLGFFATFDRPFDPTSDLSFLPPAVEFVRRSFGPAAAFGVQAAAVLLAVLVVALLILAVSRLTRLLVAHRTATTRAVAGLSVVWVAAALTGVQVVTGVPVAARTYYDRVVQVSASLRDRGAFADELAQDGFRDTPDADLLAGLRGKDVVLAFVESYGRVALENPVVAEQVAPVLADGERRLRAAGYGARSGFLTSSTSGGGSWLAHSTLQAGVWVDTQGRYNSFVDSDRLTISGAFGQAGWRTVGVLPGNDRDWPEGALYGYDQIYDGRNIGYRGPAFTFSSIPDQYTMSAFQRLERAQPHPPLMAEIDLLSSHAPWDPVPRLVDWTAVGDGTVFGTTTGAGDLPDSVFQRDHTRVLTDYGRATAYSLDSLISYVQTYGDDNLVLVFLGDHQPAPIVAGEGATRDVPITIVARDPAVLAQVSAWGWTDGLAPALQAPVWRMDTFRDRFLAAFTPRPHP
jgi:hypothetical protein